MNVSALSAQLPNLGDKLYDVVSKEDPSAIREEIQALVSVSSEVAQLVGAVIGTVH